MITMDPTAHRRLTAEQRECLGVVNATHDLCIAVIEYCLHVLGEERAGNPHIRAMRNCVLACDAVRDSLLYEPHAVGQHPLLPRYIDACAEASMICANSCERLAADDELLIRCSATCRDCESTCIEMLERAGVRRLSEGTTEGRFE